MNTEKVMIEEPRIAKLLFSDVRFAWLWLPLRLYLGYMWFEAGWHKFVDPKWMGSGEALLEFWKRGLKMTPKPAISFDWYRSFIEYLINAEGRRIDSRSVCRSRRVLRWTYELELHHGRIGFDQRHALRHRDLVGARMAQRRLDRTRSLVAADGGNSLEARSPVRSTPHEYRDELVKS